MTMQTLAGQAERNLAADDACVEAAGSRLGRAWLLLCRDAESGQRPFVDDTFLKTLGGDGVLSSEEKKRIIVMEHQLRLCGDPIPDIQEYLERFPDLFGELMPELAHNLQDRLLILESESDTTPDETQPELQQLTSPQDTTPGPQKGRFSLPKAGWTVAALVCITVLAGLTWISFKSSGHGRTDLANQIAHHTSKEPTADPPMPEPPADPVMPGPPTVDPGLDDPTMAEAVSMDEARTSNKRLADAYTVLPTIQDLTRVYEESAESILLHPEGSKAEVEARARVVREIEEIFHRVNVDIRNTKPEAGAWTLRKRICREEFTFALAVCAVLAESERDRDWFFQYVAQLTDTRRTSQSALPSRHRDLATASRIGQIRHLFSELPYYVDKATTELEPMFDPANWEWRLNIRTTPSPLMARGAKLLEEYTWAKWNLSREINKQVYDISSSKKPSRMYSIEVIFPCVMWENGGIALAKGESSSAVSWFEKAIRHKPSLFSHTENGRTGKLKASTEVLGSSNALVHLYLALSSFPNNHAAASIVGAVSECSSGRVRDAWSVIADTLEQQTPRHDEAAKAARRLSEK